MGHYKRRRFRKTGFGLRKFSNNMQKFEGKIDSSIWRKETKAVKILVAFVLW
jgi:hypothetical protein